MLEFQAVHIMIISAHHPKHVCRLSVMKQCVAFLSTPSQQLYGHRSIEVNTLQRKVIHWKLVMVQDNVHITVWCAYVPCFNNIIWKDSFSSTFYQLCKITSMSNIAVQAYPFGVFTLQLCQHLSFWHHIILTILCKYNPATYTLGK